MFCGNMDLHKNCRECTLVLFVINPNTLEMIEKLGDEHCLQLHKSVSHL